MPEVPLFSSALPEDTKTEIARHLPYAQFLPPDPALPEPICHHPDTLVCTIPGFLFLPQVYYQTNRIFFDALAAHSGVIICPLPGIHGKRYPEDAGYNACLCGRYCIGKLDALSPGITDKALQAGYTPVSVRQGYTACACLVLQNTLFTADPSVQRTCASLTGISVCSLPPLPVKLPGYACGFIGGCGGLCGNVLYWFGRPNHIDLAPVHTYCRQHGITECPLSVSDTPGLWDYGGIRIARRI